MYVQSVDEEETSSPEWDRVYPLLDSPSEEETVDFGVHTPENDQEQPDPAAGVADEEESQEDPRKLQSVQETCQGEDGMRELNPQPGTTHDSGVEAEDLQGTTVSQEYESESVVDTGTSGEKNVSDLSAEF